MDYLYKAEIENVVDGDTIDVSIDLSSFPRLKDLIRFQVISELIDVGFQLHIPADWAIQMGYGDKKMWLRSERIRLYGINAPEKNTEPGKVSLGYVRSLLSTGTCIMLQTFRVKQRTKQEKYGRYLGIIFLEDGTNLNDELVRRGFAVPFMTNPS
jgi:endonuclease YncB( thermonuclease family)